MSLIKELISQQDFQGIKDALTRSPQLANEFIDGQHPLLFIIEQYLNSYGKNEEFYTKNLEIFKILLQQGADPNVLVHGVTLYDHLNNDFQYVSLETRPIPTCYMDMMAGDNSWNEEQKKKKEKFRELLKNFKAMSYLDTCQDELSNAQHFEPLRQRVEQVKQIEKTVPVMQMASGTLPSHPFKTLIANDEGSFLEIQREHSGEHLLFWKRVNFEVSYPCEVWLLPKTEAKRLTEPKEDKPEFSALSARKRLTWDLTNVQTASMLQEASVTTTGTQIGEQTLSNPRIDFTKNTVDYHLFVKSVSWKSLAYHLETNFSVNVRTHDHLSFLARHLSASGDSNPHLVFKVPSSAILCAYGHDATQRTFEGNNPQAVWEYLLSTMEGRQHELQQEMQAQFTSDFETPRISTEVGIGLSTRGRQGTREATVRNTREHHNEIVVLGNSFLPEKEKIELIGIAFHKNELDFFNGLAVNEDNFKGFAGTRITWEKLTDTEKKEMAVGIDAIRHSGLPILLLDSTRLGFANHMAITQEASWLLRERKEFLPTVIKLTAMQKTAEALGIPFAHAKEFEEAQVRLALLDTRLEALSQAVFAKPLATRHKSENQLVAAQPTMLSQFERNRTAIPLPLAGSSVHLQFKKEN